MEVTGYRYIRTTMVDSNYFIEPITTPGAILEGNPHPTPVAIYFSNAKAGDKFAIYPENQDDFPIYYGERTLTDEDIERGYFIFNLRATADFITEGDEWQKISIAGTWLSFLISDTARENTPLVIIYAGGSAILHQSDSLNETNFLQNQIIEGGKFEVYKRAPGLISSTVNFTIEGVEASDISYPIQGRTILSSQGNWEGHIRIVSDDIAEGPNKVYYVISGTAGSASFWIVDYTPSITVRTDRSTVIREQSVNLEFVLSDDSVDFDASDIICIRGRIVDFLGQGRTYSATFVPDENISANAYVRVSSGQFSDLAGNLNADGPDADNQVSFFVDTLPPVIGISTDQSSLRSGQVANITFVLSEDATDFDLTDIEVSNGTLSNFSGQGRAYSATFVPDENISANAYVRVSSGQFSDLSGNLNADGPDADNQVSFFVDTLPPAIEISTDLSSLRSGQVANLTFVLSEDATDFDLTDIEASNGTLSNFSGQGRAYSATFVPDENISANAYVRISSGQFSDLAGNLNADGPDADNQVSFFVDTVSDGVMYHWKSHILLSGVQVGSISEHAGAADNRPFDLRAAAFDAATSTLTIEIWSTPAAASANFDFNVSSTGASGASFTSALGASWTVLTNTTNPGAISVSGFDGNLSGFASATQLGTLTLQYALGTSAISALFSGLGVGEQSAADLSLSIMGQVTGSDGRFSLSDDGAASTPIKLSRSTSDTGNAVTSADALAALRIAVGLNPNVDPDGAGPLQPLRTSPYQFMAADANGSGTVTSADALAILRMAVKLPDALPNEWFFVEESRDFWNEVTQQFALTRTAVAWDRSVVVDANASPPVGVVGVLKGDVNGSWSAPAGSIDLDTVNPSYFANLATRMAVPTDQWGV